MKNNREGHNYISKMNSSDINRKCFQQLNDDGAGQVIRTTTYTLDLHAPDTVYHEQRTANCRTGTSITQGATSSQRVIKDRSAGEA